MRHINRTIFYYLSFFVWHFLTGYIEGSALNTLMTLKTKSLTSNIFDNDERSALACKEYNPLEMNAMKVWRWEDCEKLDSLNGCGGGVKN